MICTEKTVEIKWFNEQADKFEVHEAFVHYLGSKYCDVADFNL